MAICSAVFPRQCDTHTPSANFPLLLSRLHFWLFVSHFGHHKSACLWKSSTACWTIHAQMLWNLGTGTYIAALIISYGFIFYKIHRLTYCTESMWYYKAFIFQKKRVWEIIKHGFSFFITIVKSEILLAFIGLFYLKLFEHDLLFEWSISQYLGICLIKIHTKIKLFCSSPWSS